MRHREFTAVLGAALAVLAAGQLAAPSATAAPTVVLASVAAPTTLGAAMNTCLRQATNNPGGTLVFVDLRLSRYQVGRLVETLQRQGRPTCVVHDRTMTVERAGTWYAGLPEARRADTVVLAVPGSMKQYDAWRPNMPFRRLLGAYGSGISSGSLLNWKHAATGTWAAMTVLARLRERMIRGAAWGGTNPALLTTSSRAQCLRAMKNPRGVTVLGDSITSHSFDSLDRQLKARGYVPCIYAQFSSRLAEHLARVRAGKVHLAASVIVALGNNDIFNGPSGYPYSYRSQATSLLRLLNGRNVVWPTIWRTKRQTWLPRLQHNATSANTIDRDLARDRPHMVVPPWDLVLKAHPSLQYDGIHLTPTGVKKRSSMFAAALDELLASA